jgi:hypothetical protein
MPGDILEIGMDMVIEELKNMLVEKILIVKQLRIFGDLYIKTRKK